MSHEVEANPYLGLVTCTLWGEVWLEERAKVLDEVLTHFAQARATGRPHRILIDMIGAHCANEPVEASTAFAERLANEDRLRGCRIAYLYPPGARINQDVEQHAQARAFRFRRFATTTEALDWLLADERVSRPANALPPLRGPLPQEC